MKKGDIVEVDGNVALVLAVDKDQARVLVFPPHAANATIEVPKSTGFKFKDKPKQGVK